MTPLRLFRRVAVAEAITWALLLVGMFLKYVTATTDLGVRVFGLVHGVVFIAYALVVLVVWVEPRGSAGGGVRGRVSGVHAWATMPVDRWAERRGLLGDRWRLRESRPSSPAERVTAWLLNNPARGLASGVVAVVGLTGLALLVGPPV